MQGISLQLPVSANAIVYRDFESSVRERNEANKAQKTKEQMSLWLTTQ